MNLNKYIVVLTLIAFSFLGLCPGYGAVDQDFSINALPLPGHMISPSARFDPTMLDGIHIHPDNPLMFDFILDADGQTDEKVLKQEGQELVKYFLASLTIPARDQWVNLSPYEKSKIAPGSFDQTAMGRDMLAQDYVLKQLTASLIYPEKSLGKEFWRRVYAQAQEKFGTTQIPVNTFNKVWIVADKVRLFSRNNTVYIISSHLKVLLEEDYLALQKHALVPSTMSSIGANIVREIVLPEVEKEVNTGRNFALLRQVYHSVILAAWYKKSLTEALLNQIYSDQKKISGINLNDPFYKEQIFQRYMRAYKKGVFNLIKEDTDPVSAQVLPRKYFSGGVHIVPDDFAMVDDSPAVRKTLHRNSGRYVLSVHMDGMPSVRKQPKDAAMSIEQKLARWVPLLNIKTNRSPTTDFYLGKVNKVARFLRAKDMETLIRKKLYVKRFKDVFIIEEDTNTFQVGWHDGNLYIERGFLNYLEKFHASGQDKFDLFSRTVIRALVDNQHENYHAQYEYAKTLESARPEFSRLERNFDFDGIYQRGLSTLVNNTTPEDLQKKLGIPVVRHNGNVVQNTESGTGQLESALEEAVYRVAVNHMNGEINLYNKARVSEDDPVSVKGKNLKVGTLAYAGNIPTDAHTILTALKSMAESKSDDFLILLTKGDRARKPALEEMFEPRFEMSTIIFEYIFGKMEGDHIPLVRVMPQLPNDQGLNGEEKVIPLAELNKDAESLDIAYTSGGDHYLTLSGYKEVTQESMEDFLYYARLPGYKELLGRIRAFDDGSHTADLDRLIQAAELGQLEELIQSQPSSVHKIQMPLLDTVSKLYLDNMYLRKHGFKDVKVRMISVVRGPDTSDQLRDQMISNKEIEVVKNVGIDTEISSTIIRKGVIKFFRTGEIDYDDFAFAPLPVLEYIFKPENRQYLYFLARLQKANLPQALPLMDPLATPEREQTIRAEENQALKKVIPPNFEIGESLINDEHLTTTVSIVNTQTRQPAVTMKYNVQESIDNKGKPQIKINFIEDEHVHHGVQAALADALDAGLRRYIYRVNGANLSELSETDRAMGHQNVKALSEPVAIPSYGGIDFDPSNLDMEESGQKIEVHFDQALAEQFKRRGVAGFYPRVINIEEMPDILPLFGLSHTDQPS